MSRTARPVLAALAALAALAVLAALAALAVLGMLAGCDGLGDDPDDDDDDLTWDDDDSTADDDTTAGDDDSAAADDDSADDDDSTPGDDDDTTVPEDLDGDGVPATEDCDDNDPSIHPGAPGVLDVPGTYPTIQDAIDAAVDGDVICVGAGTFSENLSIMDLEISLFGVGADATIIDGGGQGTTVTIGGYPFGVTSAVLERVTVSGGSNHGIWVSDTLTASEIVVRDNSAESGGGVYACNFGSLSLTDVTITGNVADSLGGGVYLEQLVGVELVRVTIEDNEAFEGGGLYQYRCGEFYTGGEGVDPIYRDVIVRGNRAYTAGGVQFDHAGVDVDGLIIEANSAVNNLGGGYIEATTGNIRDLLVMGNEAGDHGGGLWLHDAEVTIDQFAVLDNTTSWGSGGGLIFTTWQGDPPPLLTNGIIAGNSAPSGDGGGVLMNNDALLDLDNVVIVGNGAGREGGGIFLGDEAVLTGSAVVLAQNAAASGGGVWTDGGTLSLTFSDLWGNIPDDLVGAVDPTGADGNVAVDPQFNDLSAATAAGWDLHLQTGSPLVDAGDPALLDPDGSQQDMGAYGGAAAGDGDLDQDGYRGWWQPGPYDAATYPGQGWDCDDLDPDVFPGAGC